MRIHKSIEIKAPGKTIWPLLVEPQNILKWCPLEIISFTGNQRSGLKTSFYFEESVIWRLLMMNFLFAEWALNESVAFKMISGNIVKGYEQRHTMHPIPSGTLFTCFEDVKLPYGFIGKAMGLFRKPVSETLWREC